MGEGRSHWSSMVLRKSQTCFSDRHTHPNSMYLNFCHVLKHLRINLPPHPQLQYQCCFEEVFRQDVETFLQSSQ